MEKSRRLMAFAALLLSVICFVLLTGCSDSETMEDGTYTIEVKSISDKTISGVVGELSQSGSPGEMPDGEPPERPDGDDTTDSSASEKVTNVSNNNGGETDSSMPEPPDGGMGGTPPGGNEFNATEDEATEFTVTDATKITVEFMQGSQEGSIDDISKGSVLEVTIKDGKPTKIVIKNLNSGGGFGGSGTVTNGTSAKTIDEDDSISDESYTSTGDDENALRVDSAEVTLDNITVDKSAGATSNAEDGDFYGQNAAFLALNEATVTIKNSEFTSAAQNGNGVFSYGEGTTVNITDSTIKTTKDNSGGIQTTGGGTMNASDLTVTTEGKSSAAIRSDRGGGTVKVDGGSYTTSGTGSPAIYSTADITVSNAELTANASEGAAIEGKNSISLVDCDLTGKMQERTTNSGENLQAVLIYQSMSGDSEIGSSAFSAEGGSITSLSGDMLYVTNTHCTIDLSNVDFTLANDTFLKIAGNDGSNGWGTVGDNGGEVDMSTDDQAFEGDITVDEISSLNLSMNNGSSFSGAINADDEGGEVNLTMSADSTWKLTGDSYISSFDGDASSVDTNGFTLYVDGKEFS